MNSAVRRLRQETSTVFLPTRLTDSKIAHLIKNKALESTLSHRETKKKRAGAYRLTYSVLKELQDQQDKGSAVGIRALTTAMWVMMKHGLPRAVPRLFDHMVSKRIKPEVIAWNILAGSYASTGSFDMMWGSIHKMKEASIQPNVMTYNTCIGQASRAEGASECFKLFSQMVAERIVPDSHSWSRLISSCDTVHKAQQTLDAMQQSMQPTFVHFNAVLAVCLKKLDDTSGELFFRSMLAQKLRDCKPNTTSYTTLMTIYKNQGRFDNVVEVYNRMKTFAITPNTATYIVFLGACDMMATRGGPEQAKYISVAVTAAKQAVREGLDDPSLLITASRFLLTHKGHNELVALRDFLNDHDIDMPKTFVIHVAEATRAIEHVQNPA
ncbi:Pentatricopeptide repeat-containing protein [Diplonema papillatum]|nr:Pentatricopeptide repeat-containing protein [Diplonema papillatum]